MCRMSRMRRAPSALLAATLIVATGCGGGDGVGDGDGSAESTAIDATTSTLDATSRTTAHPTGSDPTVAPPERTSTTIPPTSSSIPPPASTRPPSGTGVFGTVTAGPTCPVAQAENPCDPQPVDAEIEARTPTGAIIATTHTNDAGTYDLQLAPATYTLVATTGPTPLPRCTPTTVTVTPGGTVQANIDCDTGIR
jgi:hypothetical protein